MHNRGQTVTKENFFYKNFLSSGMQPFQNLYKALEVFLTMKLPKAINRMCPFCRKHSEHKVSQAKSKTRSSIHPLTRYGPHRSGIGHGFGNLGKFGSKPALTKWKMVGSKQSKKVVLMYECKTCKKQHQKSQGFRAKRVEFK